MTGTELLDTLGTFCWPYLSLPPALKEAASTEAHTELTNALADLRKPDLRPGLLSYALRRLEENKDYGREPAELHADIAIELFRLVQDNSLGNSSRRKCALALQQSLRGLRKQGLSGRGLQPMPTQAMSFEGPLKRLQEALDWRSVQAVMLGELERTSRGAPVEPPSGAQHLAESLAGVINELRHWTDKGAAEEILGSLGKFMDPSQKSLVLFSRLMLMALPTESCEQLVQDGRLFRWWDLLPKNANSRYSLMWTTVPARAAKVRWASGQPRSPEPVLSQERLCTLLDIVAGTMGLPVDGGKSVEMDHYAEDCQWAFLGKTTYRLVAKYLVYSLEPLEKSGKPYPEGSTWAALEMLCRRLAACMIHTGAWTWHVRIFICEMLRGYYVRICRERFKQPGCVAHPSFHLTVANDEAMVKLFFPLIMNALTLQSGGAMDHVQTGTPTCLSFISRLALMTPACWDDIRSFIQDAVHDLADPMSVRHNATLYILSLITPLLVYACPGLILEAADLALQGIDATDPMKTMVSAGFFVNLFVQVPTLDLSCKDLPDSLPSALADVLPLPAGGALVPGATTGDLQIVTSTLPDLCHNLLERVLESVQAQPKPSKKDAMAALDLAGPRLLSTALFLAMKQGETFMVEQMGERLAEWCSLTLLPNAVKAVGMLVGALALASPAAAGKVMDAALKKLQVGAGGDLAQLGESECLWHLHVVGAAARFAGVSLVPRRAALEARIRAALGDKRKAVRKSGCKLVRRILSGLTAPYTGDLTGDNSLGEALHRWAGARSISWGAPIRPIVFHVPSAEELDFAKSLCLECIETVKTKAEGGDEDIYLALCLIKSVVRGVACLYTDERQGTDAAPMVSTLPNDLGPKLLAEFSQLLLTLCPRLGCPGHPFEATAIEANGRPKLLIKALQLVVGIVHGERRPVIPDLFQIRGFESGTVRQQVSSEAFTQKVHFMSAWRDLSRVWYNLEVLSLMNRRLSHRPAGFKYEGVRRRLAELLFGYVLNANSMVSGTATAALSDFLKVHYGAKTALLHDSMLPLQERTIAGAAGIDTEHIHLAQAALEGFARTTARLFWDAWRKDLPVALSLTSVAIRTVHAFSEEGKSVHVKPASITMQFELMSKLISARSAASPGDAAETCRVVGTLLAMLKKPGLHWRTKVCILATVGPALRILHTTAAAGELDAEVLKTWLGELLGSLTSADAQPQVATIAVAELTTAMRSALRRPGLPLDRVLHELLPRAKGILALVAKTMSGLHQGFLGADNGATAQADPVQVMVRACTGVVGVSHLSWSPCPSGQSWMVHSTFFQTYIAFCTKRGDTHLVEELKALLTSLQAQPKSEAEDHVVFLEAFGGALRAARRWPEPRQNELWAALAPIAAEELKLSEEVNIRNWQFLVYYVIVGVSRRLRPRAEAPAEDVAIRRLAAFLANARGDVTASPMLPAAVVGEDGEASSHAQTTRLRLLQVLLATLQRRRAAVSDDTRSVILQGLVPALKEGISHPYKQVHEESAKAMVLSLCVGLECEVLSDLRAWIAQGASTLGVAIRDAPKESSTSTACEGLVYVLLHGLLGRRMRSLALQSLHFLLAAAAADDHELRALAGLALGCLGQSPQRGLGTLALSEKLVAGCQTALEGEDSGSAQRVRRLEAAATLVGSSALRHDFIFRLSDGGKATKLCHDTLLAMLGDKRVEVRIASQAALAPLLGLETTATCKKMAKAFAAAGGSDEAADRAVHGLSAMLRVAGSLGVPDWLGDVIEALSKAGQRPESKKEVEKTVQAFMKQQQQSRDVWKRCQKRLTEEQMDLLKARQGTMSYYS